VLVRTRWSLLLSAQDWAASTCYHSVSAAV